MKENVKKICLTLFVSILSVGYATAQCVYQSTPYTNLGITTTIGGGWNYHQYYFSSTCYPTWKIYHSRGVMDNTILIDISVNSEVCVFLVGTNDLGVTKTVIDSVALDGSNVIHGWFNFDLSLGSSYDMFIVEVHGCTAGYINIDIVPW
jgi:hypothetical protein